MRFDLCNQSLLGLAASTIKFVLSELKQGLPFAALPLLSETYTTCNSMQLFLSFWPASSLSDASWSQPWQACKKHTSPDTTEHHDHPAKLWSFWFMLKQTDKPFKCLEAFLMQPKDLKLWKMFLRGYDGNQKQSAGGCGWWNVQIVDTYFAMLRIVLRAVNQELWQKTLGFWQETEKPWIIQACAGNALWDSFAF